MDFPDKIRAEDRSAFFKSLADATPHTIIIVHPENYKMLYINRVQPGYQMEHVIGQEIFAFVWPEFHQHYRDRIEDLKKNGKTQDLVSEGHSSEGRSWYRTTFSLLRSNDSKIEGIILNAEDISDAKRKGIENLDNEEKLKAIINNTNDIISSIDLDYRLTGFNSTFAQTVKTGFNIDMKQGMDILPFIDPKKHDHLRAIYKRVESGETCYDVESFETRGGEFIYFESSYNPIRNAEQRVVGISIFSKNITERVKGEQKLKSAIKEKDVLLSEIHHRIKNNLAVVSSLLHLQELNLQSSEAKEALSESRKRIRSTALVHELLYRKESFSSICINDYISELFTNLRINKNAQLIMKGEQVMLDLTTAMPLGMMMNEIMMNSFKHSIKGKESGTIKVELYSKDKELNIFYTDENGIIPENIELKNASSTGMTLINTFAEQLEGSIELNSRVPLQYKIKIPLNV